MKRFATFPVFILLAAMVHAGILALPFAENSVVVRENPEVVVRLNEISEQSSESEAPPAPAQEAQLAQQATSAPDPPEPSLDVRPPAQPEPMPKTADAEPAPTEAAPAPLPSPVPAPVTAASTPMPISDAAAPIEAQTRSAEIPAAPISQHSPINSAPEAAPVPQAVSFAQPRSQLSSSDEMDAWFAEVKRRIDERKTYPPLMKKLNRQGWVLVDVTISSTGSLSRLEVLDGTDSFRSSSVAGIRKAAPFTPPPSGNSARVRLKLIYELR